MPRHTGSLARRLGGSRAKAAGADFEELVRNQLEIAKQSKIVGYCNHNEPRHVAAGKGRFVPVAAGLADWSGALYGGIDFALEAKSESGRRFYRERITEEQEDHLGACVRSGGLALLAVQFRDDKRGLCAEYVIPWREVPWERAVSAESLTAEICAPWIAVRPFILAPFVKQCPTCRMTWPAHREPWCCGVKLLGGTHGVDLQEAPQANHQPTAQGPSSSGARRERPAFPGR